MEKVKIVLDADVIIHFSKANRLSILPSILPEYDHIVLSTVYNELISIQQQIDNQVIFLKNLSVEEFNPTGDMRREYAVFHRVSEKEKVHVWPIAGSPTM